MLGNNVWIVLALCACACSLTSCHSVPIRRQKRSLGKLLMHIRYDPVRLIRYSFAWDVTKEIMKTWRDIIPTVFLLPITSRLPDTAGVTKFIKSDASVLKSTHPFVYNDEPYPKDPYHIHYLNYYSSLDSKNPSHQSTSGQGNAEHLDHASTNFDHHSDNYNPNGRPAAFGNNLIFVAPGRLHPHQFAGSTANYMSEGSSQALNNFQMVSRNHINKTPHTHRNNLNEKHVNVGKYYPGEKLTRFHEKRSQMETNPMNSNSQSSQNPTFPIKFLPSLTIPGLGIKLMLFDPLASDGNDNVRSPAKVFRGNADYPDGLSSSSAPLVAIKPHPKLIVSKGNFGNFYNSRKRPLEGETYVRVKPKLVQLLTCMSHQRSSGMAADCGFKGGIDKLIPKPLALSHYHWPPGLPLKYGGEYKQRYNILAYGDMIGHNHTEANGNLNLCTTNAECNYSDSGEQQKPQGNLKLPWPSDYVMRHVMDEEGRSANFVADEDADDDASTTRSPSNTYQKYNKTKIVEIIKRLKPEIDISNAFQSGIWLKHQPGRDGADRVANAGDEGTVLDEGPHETSYEYEDANATGDPLLARDEQKDSWDYPASNHNGGHRRDYPFQKKDYTSFSDDLMEAESKQKRFSMHRYSMRRV